VSNLTGRQLTEPPAPTYWRDQARQPVRFADGLETLAGLGCSLFLEVGPGTAALAAVRDCLGPRAALALPSIGRTRSDLQTMKASLRELYLAGSTIDWKRVHDGERRRRIALPTYPFERTRYWLEPASTPELRSVDRPRIENDAPAAEQTFYSVAWRNVESGLASDSVEPGSWLIYADDAGVGSAVARIVRRRGGRATLVRRPTPRRTGRSASARTILCLTALDAPPLASVEPSQLANVERTVAAPILSAVRSLTTGAAAADSRVWCVTRRAQCVPAPTQMTDPIQALVWGIGRTAALEFPGRWGGLVDLGSAAASVEEDAAAIVDAILGSNGENEIAVRDGRRYVARLERRHRERPGTTLRVRPDRTYLITGGLGMLGLTVARWLADRGARHLVLVSRHADASRRGASIAALEERGAAVRVIAADVSKPIEVRRLLQVIDDELPPLAGVVHSAGELADGILERMDWPAFTRATAAKVHGAWLLHHHTRRQELDFFLLQSSLLSLLGSAGQANYTAANAFLDSLVDHRRALGLPATAINWGPWADSGMAAAAGARGGSIWRQRGISLISTESGRAVLDFLASHAFDHVGVTSCDWPQYARSLHARSPLLDAVAPQVAAGATADLGEQLRGAPPARRRALLIDALGRQLARELGFDQRLDPRQPLQQLGVDSLMSVNLANRLESSLGIRIPVVKLLRSPSLERLADEVLSEIAPAPDDAPAGATVPESPPARAPVSMSRGNGWLVFPRPNPSADIRLFCFNYAGGGAATYRPWAERVAPAVELVAIEPPGRGSRIDEPPIVRLDLWLETLMRELRPYLDRPAAFFGHCLGGLTMFETARRLASEVDLVHLFVSGCRPPHRLNELSLFEEDLLLTLTKDDRFDPLSALHEQPEHVFATIIRQFDIGVTDEFLSRAELRNLLLPAVRADFELTWRYRVGAVRPWDIPITCFTGLDDTYVTRECALEWHRYTQRELRIHFRAGTHFLVAEDREFIVSTINRTLISALPARAPAQAVP
jgi:surfactin synthase thioesterase subunit/NAD(P)-dependent dehydrogenase (short-subunit alcohol dehydrogenase family)/acyl carrier protein